MRAATAGSALASYPSSADPKWTDVQYRAIFGWQTVQIGRRVMLAFGRGLVALSVPAQRGTHVVEHLRRFGSNGPVLAIGVAEPRWVFFADDNAYVTFRVDLPPDVEFLGCGKRLPVPAPNSCTEGLRWIIEPDPVRRWLPTLDALALAVRERP